MMTEHAFSPHTIVEKLTVEAVKLNFVHIHAETDSIDSNYKQGAPTEIDAPRPLRFATVIVKISAICRPPSAIRNLKSAMHTPLQPRSQQPRRRQEIGEAVVVSDVDEEFAELNVEHAEQATS